MAVAKKPSEQAILSSEDFISRLAHELRNPLAPISNVLHVIEKTIPKDSLGKLSIDILTRQVNYIIKTIDELLDIAKILKNEVILNWEDVEICSLIKEVYDNCKSTFESRKQLIKITIPEQGIWIRGDRTRIKQIISQLLTNAAKFTNTGGKISLTISYGNMVMINIKDSGIGIPVNTIPVIFDLFTQTDHTRNLVQGGGLGVGLKLIQELTKFHGGTIEAYSEGIGKGSEFSVLLPILKITDYVELEHLKPETYINQNSLDILVVDDHIDTAESLSILLKMWEHNVHVCHNGVVASQIAKIHQPDVALLDIGLPGQDGYEVAEVLKKMCPNMALIAITGYGQCVDRRRTTNAGFRHHLVKPVDPNFLKNILNEIQ